MSGRKNGLATKRRILAAACKIFAEKGFRDATHSEICRRSKANIAAINYHFHSKEKLYLEAFALALKKSFDKHPADGGASQEASPEERLKGRIFALVSRMADPRNMVFEIMRRERGSGAASLLEESMNKTIAPIRSGMRSVIAELLGPNAKERDVKLCLVCVLAQCLHPAMRGRKRGERDSRAAFWSEFSPEELSSYVFEFCMAAIKSMREKIDARPRQASGFKKNGKKKL